MEYNLPVDNDDDIWTDEEEQATDKTTIDPVVMKEITDTIDILVGSISKNRRKSINEIKKMIITKLYRKYPYISSKEKNFMRQYLTKKIEEFLIRTVEALFNYDNEIIYTGVIHKNKLVYVSDDTLYVYDKYGTLIGTKDDKKNIYLFNQ